jgi:hypothetical protein
MTNLPNNDQNVPVSTTTRPVTQTAEVAVKKAFRKPGLLPLALEMGSVNKSAPINITAANPKIRISAGERCVT